MGYSFFGLRVGLEGEKEFKGALADMRRGFNVLGSEMQLVAARFDQNDRSVAASTARKEALNKQIDLQNQRVDTLRAALDNARESFGENDKRTQAWQIQLNKAQAELIGLEKNLGEAEKALSMASSATETNAGKHAELSREIDETSKAYVEAVRSMGKNSDEAQSLKKHLTELTREQQSLGKSADELEDGNKRAKASFADLGDLLSGNVSKSVTDLKAGFVKTEVQIVEGAKSMGQSIVQFAKDTATGENTVKALGAALQDKLESRLRGTSKEMDSTADATGELGDELKSTGNIADDAGERFEGLKSTLKGVGAAVCGAMAAIGAGAVAAGAALYNMATETAEAGNAINQTSLQLGMSREAVQEWDYVLGQNNASIYYLTYGMRRLTGAMGSVEEDGGKVGQAITRLGLDFDEVRRKSPEDAMDALVRAFQDMEEGADKTALALQIFGQRGGLMLTPMLNTTAEATDALRKEAHALGMVMSDDMIDASAGFNNSMDRLQRTFGGVKNAIGAQLLPGMSMVLDGFTDLIAGNDGAVESIMAGANEIIKSISETLPQIISTLTRVVEAVVEIAPDIILALVDGLIGELPALMAAAVDIITALLEGIVYALPILLDAAIQVIITLVQGITDALPTLIPAMVSAVLTMVQALVDNMPMILDAALQLILGLAKGLIEAIPELIEAMPQIIVSLVDFLIGSIPEIIQAGIQLLTAIIGALPEIITAIVDALPQIIEGIITAIIENIPLIVQTGWQLLTGLLTGILNAVPELLRGMRDAMRSLINAVLEIFGIRSPSRVFADIGRNLIHSLWGGISELWGWLREKVSGIGRMVVDAIRGVFGINSPSMVFANIGGNLMQGLWNGIQNAQDWLLGQIRNLGHLVTSTIKSLFGINSPSAVFRDEIGANLAYGLGEGFKKTMEDVAKDMCRSIPKDFDFDVDVNAHGNRSSSMDSGAAGDGGVALTLHIDKFYNNTDKDIRQLADDLSVLLAGRMNREAMVR